MFIYMVLKLSRKWSFGDPIPNGSLQLGHDDENLSAFSYPFDTA
jgi:hypothetical protein